MQLKGGVVLIVNTDGPKPIYVQISEWLETEILSEKIKKDEKIYSQYQLADMYNINPATAAKGLNLLADEQIVYKKRGLGMFVAKDAKKNILKKRKAHMLKNLVTELVIESRRLEVDEDELIKMIRTVNREEKQ